MWKWGCYKIVAMLEYLNFIVQTHVVILNQSQLSIRAFAQDYFLNYSCKHMCKLYILVHWILSIVRKLSLFVWTLIARINRFIYNWKFQLYRFIQWNIVGTTTSRLCPALTPFRQQHSLRRAKLYSTPLSIQSQYWVQICTILHSAECRVVSLLQNLPVQILISLFFTTQSF